ncbi:hypothetical protein GALL_532870 [mine drainage metagenome]|uniref:Uncharacterized protein n=1 Tax=mine drainage metagenome TaxID=410659 RepID=A0A1J5PCB8_9ZZZZ
MADAQTLRKIPRTGIVPVSLTDVIGRQFVQVIVQRQRKLLAQIEYFWNHDRECQRDPFDVAQQFAQAARPVDQM